MTERYGFVYIWRDRKHNRYYVGCHWGSEDDGYICSSSWMKQAYKHRPQDFKRKILATNIASRALLFESEQKWLNLIKEGEVGKRYYNLNTNCLYHWAANQEKQLTIREKLSCAQKKNFEDPEYRERFMDTRKNLPPQTVEAREKRRVSMMGKNVGRPKTEKFYEARKKLKGVSKHSPEHLLHLKETSTFKMLNKTRVTCRICGTEGNVGNIARYHNDRCKYAGAV